MSAPQSAALTVSYVRSLGEVRPEEWNALEGARLPFLNHHWLHLLETSGSIRPQTGWLPLHCLVRRDGRLVAAAPLYLKGHGQGEFVYDALWADVATRLGVSYYPKLVAASPLTPVSGYRFLFAPGEDQAHLTTLILQAMLRLSQANELSGLHLLFVAKPLLDALRPLELGTWRHQGFLWKNAGYQTFADHLADFRSGARKNVLHERRALAASGVDVQMVEGPDVPADWFALMYDYYSSTNDKFGAWGCKYLTREFFLGLARPELATFLVLGAAFVPEDDRPAALALFVKSDDTLYGRYWGASRNLAFLHFELCYYAPVEYAIRHGLRFFDPGMGGEHKPRRGFRSICSTSLHHFSDARLTGVFDANIDQLNTMTYDQVEELNAMLPYRNQERGA
ncbi:GNAT family N-acetyltransferase [Fundidesulfovibrio butyratiphilus]